MELLWKNKWDGRYMEADDTLEKRYPGMLFELYCMLAIWNLWLYTSFGLPLHMAVSAWFICTLWR